MSMFAMSMPMSSPCSRNIFQPLLLSHAAPTTVCRPSTACTPPSSSHSSGGPTTPIWRCGGSEGGTLRAVPPGNTGGLQSQCSRSATSRCTCCCGARRQICASCLSFSSSSSPSRGRTSETRLTWRACSPLSTRRRVQPPPTRRETAKAGLLSAVDAKRYDTTTMKPTAFRPCRAAVRILPPRRRPPRVRLRLRRDFCRPIAQQAEAPSGGGDALVA